jgi:hypothetical protein
VRREPGEGEVAQVVGAEVRQRDLQLAADPARGREQQPGLVVLDEVRHAVTDQAQHVGLPVHRALDALAAAERDGRVREAGGDVRRQPGVALVPAEDVDAERAAAARCGRRPRRGARAGRRVAECELPARRVPGPRGVAADRTRERGGAGAVGDAEAVREARVAVAEPHQVEGDVVEQVVRHDHEDVEVGQQLRRRQQPPAPVAGEALESAGQVRRGEPAGRLQDAREPLDRRHDLVDAGQARRRRPAVLADERCVHVVAADGVVQHRGAQVADAAHGRWRHPLRRHARRHSHRPARRSAIFPSSVSAATVQVSRSDTYRRGTCRRDDRSGGRGRIDP